MAADAAGNDIEAVGIPITGFIAINWEATAPVAAAAMTYALPTGYEYLGLITQDGGYAEENEAGDRIEFFQQGYSLAGGDGSLTFKATFAESSEAVRTLLGYDATTGTRKTVTYTGEFGAFVAVKYKNGRAFLRGGVATVTEAVPSQETRGEVTSYEITFAWKWFEDTDWYRFAEILPD